jgi:hypothetical protein
VITSDSDSDDSIWSEDAQRIGRSADADVQSKPGKKTVTFQIEGEQKRTPLGEKPLNENAVVERKQTKPQKVTSGRKKTCAIGGENNSPAAAATASRQEPSAEGRATSQAGKKRTAEAYDPRSTAFLAMPLAKKIKLIQDRIEWVKQERAQAPRTFKAAFDLFCRSQDRDLSVAKKKIAEAQKALALKRKVGKKKHDANKAAHAKIVARKKARLNDIDAQEKQLQESRTKLAGDNDAEAASAATMAADGTEETAWSREGEELAESASGVS